MFKGLNRDTIALLSYLSIEYLLDEKQKSFIEQLHKLNEQKITKNYIFSVIFVLYF